MTEQEISGSHKLSALIKFSLPSVLASTWVFLSFFTANAPYGFEWQRFILFSAALSIVATVAVFVGTSLLPRRYSHGVALSVAAACILLFQYRQVGELLLLADIFSVKVQMALWGLALISGCAIAARFANRPGVYSSILVALVAMLGVNVVLLGNTLLESRSTASTAKNVQVQESSKTGPHAIISIVLDTYAHASVLSTLYGYDNRGFEQALATREFKVIPSAYSNYPCTSLSVASALDMTYRVETGEAHPYNAVSAAETINGLNATVRRFRSLGHEYAIFHAGRFHSTINCSGFEDHCLQCGGKIGEVEFLLLEKTPFSHLIRKFLPKFYGSLSAGGCPITLIGEKSLRIGKTPFFLFAHHMALHQPSNMDSDCSPLDTPVPAVWPPKSGTPQLRMQMDCLNQQTLTVVDQLISRYEDPIILISGDHGIWTDDYKESNSTALKYRHAIFTALRLPKKCQSTIPDILTPVNHYRLILACVEGKPVDLLPDRVFAVKALKPSDPYTPLRMNEVEYEQWRIK